MIRTYLGWILTLAILVDPLLDMSMYGFDGGNVVWDSSSILPTERLAWYNPTTEPATCRLAIGAWPESTADYNIVVRTSDSCFCI